LAGEYKIDLNQSFNFGFYLLISVNYLKQLKLKEDENEKSFCP